MDNTLTGGGWGLLNLCLFMRMFSLIVRIESCFRSRLHSLDERLWAVRSHCVRLHCPGCVVFICAVFKCVFIGHHLCLATSISPSIYAGVSCKYCWRSLVWSSLFAMTQCKIETVWHKVGINIVAVKFQLSNCHLITHFCNYSCWRILGKDRFCCFSLLLLYPVPS